MRKFLQPPAMIIGGMAITAVIISVFAHLAPRFPCDLQISMLFQSISSPPLLIAMKTVSYITGEWRAAIVVAVCAMIIGRRHGLMEGGLVALSGITTLVNEVLKIAIDRPRPAADLIQVLVNESGKSFPSGHAFFAVVFVGFLCYLIAFHQGTGVRKVLTVSAFVFLIVWIGASRVYLGAHWTSDVIGGYIAGLPFLWLEIMVYQRLTLRR
ncbi:MAG: phosphatase PAP2 family protein [Dehalococcoidales bacterium]|nr:phosphatase PAP2 family protein [Dehalococcoidales bacterium]